MIDQDQQVTFSINVQENQIWTFSAKKNAKIKEREREEREIIPQREREMSKEAEEVEFPSAWTGERRRFRRGLVGKMT